MSDVTITMTGVPDYAWWFITAFLLFLTINLLASAWIDTLRLRLYRKTGDPKYLRRER